MFHNSSLQKTNHRAKVQLFFQTRNIKTKKDDRSRLFG
jgi:hypothetical protein